MGIFKKAFIGLGLIGACLVAPLTQAASVTVPMTPTFTSKQDNFFDDITSSFKDILTNVLSDSQLNYSYELNTTGAKKYINSLVLYISNGSSALTQLTPSYSLVAGNSYSLFARGTWQDNAPNKTLQSYNLTLTTAPVPEPETYALMAVGLLGLLFSRKRKPLK